MAKTKELKKSPFMGGIEEEGEESSRQFWKRAVSRERAAPPFQFKEKIK